MPGQFLTDIERLRLTTYPAEVLPEDVTAYFTLTETDRAQLMVLRGDHNKLGWALQLCTLRFMGFCPDDLTTAPGVVVATLAQQLDLDPDLVTIYGDRAQTRTDHFHAVIRYLGFRLPSQDDLAGLRTWLVMQALEHDKPTLLFENAAQHLRQQKIVRPGVTVLERIVTAVREEAQTETYRRIAPLLTAELTAFLDGLLVVDEAIKGTRFDWLRQGSVSNSPKAIIAATDKLKYLRKAGIDRLDLTALNPNRIKLLASVGRKSSNQALARMADERRYPILLAFVVQAIPDITDETLDIFDRYLSGAYRTAERTLIEFRQSIARSTNEKGTTVADGGQSGA